MGIDADGNVKVIGIVGANNQVAQGSESQANNVFTSTQSGSGGFELVTPDTVASNLIGSAPGDTTGARVTSNAGSSIRIAQAVVPEAEPEREETYSDPVGRRGSPIEVQSGTNEEENFGGRWFTGRHAGPQHIKDRIHDIAVIGPGALAATGHQRFKEHPLLIGQLKSHDPPSITVNHCSPKFSTLYVSTDPNMSDRSVHFFYKMRSSGPLDGKIAAELPPLDITNCSFEGDLEIAADNDKVTLVEVPLGSIPCSPAGSKDYSDLHKAHTLCTNVP